MALNLLHMVSDTHTHRFQTTGTSNQFLELNQQSPRKYPKMEEEIACLAALDGAIFHCIGRCYDLHPLQ